MINKELHKKVDEEDRIIKKEILAKTGIRVKEISDFVNTTDHYDEALPILASHLYHDYTFIILDLLVRSLTTSRARGIANKPLFDLLARTPVVDEDMWHVVGNALVFVAEEKDYDRIYNILANKANRSVSCNYIRALAKMKANQDKTIQLFQSILEEDYEGINKRLNLIEIFRAYKKLKTGVPDALYQKYKAFPDKQVQKALQNQYSHQ